ARGAEVHAIDVPVVVQTEREGIVAPVETNPVVVLVEDAVVLDLPVGHDRAGEHHPVGAGMRDAQMPTVRVVPDVGTGGGSRRERGRRALGLGGPRAVRARARAGRARVGRARAGRARGAGTVGGGGGGGGADHHGTGQTESGEPAMELLHGTTSW